MAGNHGFTDGNKRTAWLLVEILIARSGYHLEISDEEPIDDLVVAVVSKEIDFDALVEWFQRRLARY
ncbi:MAG: hypothetical protein IE922_07440 [Sphingomonadales bacterium]|nr:hypothetical protein [Sphingomonadales bacterium]